MTEDKEIKEPKFQKMSPVVNDISTPEEEDKAMKEIYERPYNIKVLENGIKVKFSVKKVKKNALPSPLTCKFCIKAFSTKFNLNKHTRRVHQACPLCNVEFSTHKIVSEHETTVHSKK